MPTIIYTDANGEQHEEEVEVGYTLMDGAFNRQLPGMLAECGGGAACGTCHCFVSEPWLSHLPPIEDLEESMLYMVPGRKDNSRLSCQIIVTEEHDGLELQIAQNE
ncbi:MAG: 2Fe-2S iron-sulfur cluster-binding protein [Gammaproteobacteria bacterium]